MQDRTALINHDTYTETPVCYGYGINCFSLGTCVPRSKVMPLHAILGGTGSVGQGQGPKCHKFAGHGGPLLIHKGPDFF